MKHASADLGIAETVEGDNQIGIGTRTPTLYFSAIETQRLHHVLSFINQTFAGSQTNTHGRSLSRMKSPFQAPVLSPPSPTDLFPLGSRSFI